MMNEDEQKLQALRGRMLEIDRRIVEAFEERMRASEEVARVKRRLAKPVLDAEQERRVLESRAGMLGDSRWTEEVKALYERLMELSRKAQERVIGGNAE